MSRPSTSIVSILSLGKALPIVAFMTSAEVTPISSAPAHINDDVAYGSEMGSPAPIAAAIGSSMKNTSLAPADSADSRTALFSTWVMLLGTQTMIRGLTNAFLLWTNVIK